MRRPPAVSAVSADSADSTVSTAGAAPAVASVAAVVSATTGYRATACWLALGWVGLAALTVPPLRPGLGAGAGLGLLLLLWVLLTRTRTLAWQSLAVLLGLALPWSLLAGLMTSAVTSGPVQAAVTEQALTVLPLALIAQAAPARVRAFAAGDWLLTGLICGIAAQLVEELADPGGAPARYGWGPLAGGMTDGAGASFPGRPVLGALLGVTLGLAVAAWRHAGLSVLSRPAATCWRVLAVLAPVACWLLVAGAQAGWNAAVTIEETQVPWVLRGGAALPGDGFGWLLLLLAAAAALVDGGRLRNAAERAPDSLPYPAPPAVTADRWAGRLTRWAGTRTALPVSAAVWLIAALCALIAYVRRDLAVQSLARLRAISPGSGPSRREDRRRPERESWAVVAARGTAAGVLVRTVRAEAAALVVGEATAAARRSLRLVAAAGAAGLVAVGLLWVPAEVKEGLAAPARPGDPATGALVRLIDPDVTSGSWQALGTWQQVVAVLGLVALVVLAAAPLDLPLAGRRPVWLVDRSPAPGPWYRRLRSYLAVSGPVEVVVDAVSALLALGCAAVPASFTRAAARREVRQAVTDFAAAPEGFAERRRATTADRPSVPAGAPARVRASEDLPPVKLADGRLLAPLTADEERAFVAAIDELARDRFALPGTPPTVPLPADPGPAAGPGEATGPAHPAHPAEAYRLRVYGDDRRLISLRPHRWSAGQNTAYGMIGEIAWYDGRGASPYVPATLPEPVRRQAERELDRRLVEFATVVYYPASPFRALEVTTNHPLVADVFEERMARLAIPGHVVLVT